MKSATSIKVVNKLLGLICSLFIHRIIAGNVTIIYTLDPQYKPLNPDRGFYTQYEYRSSAPSVLTLSDLSSLRTTLNQTIILRYYYLDTYRTVTDPVDIAASVLMDLSTDINTLRQAGLRSILRFAYTSDPTATPTEPVKQRILNHINQISNTLANCNASDVILTIQAGFLGPWGEWHSSTNFPLDGTETWNSTAWNDRRQIIQAWMNGLVLIHSSNTTAGTSTGPIHLQVRTPGYKKLLLGPIHAPLDNFIYSPSNMSTVLAHHNDCFLASSTDYGTYTNITSDYAYLGKETLYVIMGGETCNYNPPRSSCTTALSELSKFHWTFLNAGYNTQVLTSWKDGGCYDQVDQFLGYRFVLISSSFLSKQGLNDTNVLVSNNTDDSLLSFTIQVRNDGYAAPVRNRDMSLVFRHMGSGNICLVTPLKSNGNNLSPNWRTFMGNGTVYTIAGQVRLADALMPSGTYEVLLNVEDTAIKNNLAFKTKISNGAEYNEAGTGFVKLLHTFKVIYNSTNNIKYNASTWDIICDDPSVGDIASSKVLPSTTVPGTKYVMNGNMEDNPKSQGGLAPYWDSYLSGYTVDMTFSRSGTASLRVTNGAAQQTIPLYGLTGIVSIAGYSMAVGNVSSSLGSDLALYADVTYESGNNLWGQVATFPGSVKNTWVFSNVSFILTEPAEYMNLLLLYRNDKNKGNRSVYFDDISVSIQGYDFSCAGGYYQDGLQCRWCPPGYACNSGSKTSCSTNSFSHGGALSCNSCKGCSNNGNCSSVSGLCICNDGWSGAFCSTPSAIPTRSPTQKRTTVPTIKPTRKPSSRPTRKPSAVPTKKPSRKLSSVPTRNASRKPSSRPTRKPSVGRTKKPSRKPSSRPTRKPSSVPTRKVSRKPSSRPTRKPSLRPSMKPSAVPTKKPSRKPSSPPTRKPSLRPTRKPSSVRSMKPSRKPSSRPTRKLSLRPTRKPSVVRSKKPSRRPSSRPTRKPSIV